MILGSLIASFAMGLFVLWIVFALFTLYFFRDPNPAVPKAPEAIVSPAHGKVDLIDETTEPGIHRRSMPADFPFSVRNRYPRAECVVAGRIALLKHTSGQFLSAMKTNCIEHNENVPLGIESSEQPDEKIAVRLIAGLLARRIVPWVVVDDVVERGERTSLIQFGSRCDLYLPLTTKVQAKLGDHVIGGETIVAVRG